MTKWGGWVDGLMQFEDCVRLGYLGRCVQEFEQRSECSTQYGGTVPSDVMLCYLRLFNTKQNSDEIVHFSLPAMT